MKNFFSVLFLNILLIGFAEANQDIKINKTIKKIGSLTNKIIEDENLKKFKNYKTDPKIEKLVLETKKQIKKNKFQDHVEFYKNEITKNDLNFFTEKKEEKHKKSKKNKFLNENEYIFLFISSSIPEKTLRNYIKDINKISDQNIKVVMRGFVGGMKKIKPTQDFITKILVDDPSCLKNKNLTKKCTAYGGLIFDPLLFRIFNITTVPSIVYSKEMIKNDPAKSFGYPGNIKSSSNNFLLLTGDVAFTYALSKFYKATNEEKFLKMEKELKKGFLNYEKK